MVISKCRQDFEQSIYNEIHIRIKGVCPKSLWKTNVVMTSIFYPPPSLPPLNVTAFRSRFNTEKSWVWMKETVCVSMSVQLVELHVFNHNNVLSQSKSTDNAVVKRHGLRPPPPPNVIVTLIFPQGFWTSPLSLMAPCFQGINQVCGSLLSNKTDRHTHIQNYRNPRACTEG